MMPHYGVLADNSCLLIMLEINAPARVRLYTHSRDYIFQAIELAVRIQLLDGMLSDLRSSLATISSPKQHIFGSQSAS